MVRKEEKRSLIATSRGKASDIIVRFSKENSSPGGGSGGKGRFLPGVRTEAKGGQLLHYFFGKRLLFYYAFFGEGKEKSRVDELLCFFGKSQKKDFCYRTKVSRGGSFFYLKRRRVEGGGNMTESNDFPISIRKRKEKKERQGAHSTGEVDWGEGLSSHWSGKIPTVLRGRREKRIVS